MNHALKWPCLMIALAAWCMSLAAWAQQIDVFQARVPVADRGPSAQAEAYRLALTQVLTKFSGRADLVAALPPAALRNAQALMQQFRYIESPAAGPAAPALMMEVRFNADGVRQLATNLGLPIWPLERGLVIAWVALDNGLERELLDNGAAVAEALVQQARLRGLPMLLPLMDLDDRAQVSFADVWGGFADHVFAASRRYDAQFVLLARVYRSAGGWGGQWQLSDGQQLQRWRGFAGGLPDLLANGVDQVTTAVARRYASVALAPGFVALRIYGINSVTEYGQVGAYLQSLSVVEEANPMVVVPSYTEYALRASVGAEVVARSLDLGRVLISRQGPSAVWRQPDILEYEISQAWRESRSP